MLEITVRFSKLPMDFGIQSSLETCRKVRMTYAMKNVNIFPSAPRLQAFNKCCSHPKSATETYPWQHTRLEWNIYIYIYIWSWNKQDAALNHYYKKKTHYTWCSACLAWQSWTLSKAWCEHRSRIELIVVDASEAQNTCAALAAAIAKRRCIHLLHGGLLAKLWIKQRIFLLLRAWSSSSWLALYTPSSWFAWSASLVKPLKARSLCVRAFSSSPHVCSRHVPVLGWKCLLCISLLGKLVLHVSDLLGAVHLWLQLSPGDTASSSSLAMLASKSKACAVVPTCGVCDPLAMAMARSVAAIQAHAAKQWSARKQKNWSWGTQNTSSPQWRKHLQLQWSFV